MPKCSILYVDKFTRVLVTCKRSTLVGIRWGQNASIFSFLRIPTAKTAEFNYCEAAWNTQNSAKQMSAEFFKRFSIILTGKTAENSHNALRHSTNTKLSARLQHLIGRQFESFLFAKSHTKWPIFRVIHKGIFYSMIYSFCQKLIYKQRKILLRPSHHYNHVLNMNFRLEHKITNLLGF